MIKILLYFYHAITILNIRSPNLGEEFMYICQEREAGHCTGFNNFESLAPPLFTNNITKPLSELMTQLLKDFGSQSTIEVRFYNVRDIGTAIRVADMLTVVPTISLWSKVSFPHLTKENLKDIMDHMMSGRTLKLSLHPPP